MFQMEEDRTDEEIKADDAWRAKLRIFNKVENVKAREEWAAKEAEGRDNLGYSGKTTVCGFKDNKGERILNEAKLKLEKRAQTERDQCISYNNSHRPERAVHSRKYYQKNKDKKQAQNQKYRETHSKEIKEARQKYNNANRDEINKKSRISRQKRKEEIATLRAEALKAQEVNTHER